MTKKSQYVPDPDPADSPLAESLLEGLRQDPDGSEESPRERRARLTKDDMLVTEATKLPDEEDDDG